MAKVGRSPDDRPPSNLWPLNRWQTAAIALLGLALSSYLGTFLILRQFQTRLIFKPQHPVSTFTPQALGWAYEPVTLPVPPDPGNAGDPGGSLEAWWFPGAQGDRRVILLFLGRRHAMGEHLEIPTLRHRISVLAGLGPSLLMVNYRGYGHSSGPFPTEARLYQDGAAAWQYLTGSRSRAPGEIFLYGYSLGGAVAVELAHGQPGVAGVMTEGTFTTMEAEIDALGSLRMFPVDWLVTQEFRTIDRIANLRVPLLIIHGTADTVVPVGMAQDLFGVAPGPKLLLLVDGGDHFNTALLGGEQYQVALTRFVQDYSP